LFANYGWDAHWGESFFMTAAAPPAVPGIVGESIEDPHLRSF
jgi:hypothetical protein